MADMLAAALGWVAKGWAVFPCHHPIVEPGRPVRCSCVKKDECPAIGKHPIVKNGKDDASTNPEQIRAWWKVFPDANIGGVPASAGLLAFDIDSEDAVAAARGLGLFAEPTFEVRTGKGVHRYYTHPPLPSGASVHGIVVRSALGHVMLPPSLHALGSRYEVSDDAPAIPLPPIALAAVAAANERPASRARVRLSVTQDRIGPGERHGALLALAGSLASSQVDPEMALRMVLNTNAVQCDPPKDPDEVKRLVEYAYQEEKGKHAEIARHLMIAQVTPRVIRPTRPVPLANPFEQPLPGILEEMVAWSMRTAPHPVRMYSVAAALGVASTVCARRYTTSRQNYSTLYLLVIGKSGTGKEHVRRSAHALLRAGDAATLIGPNEWTSRSAVWSSLYSQPQSLAIVDEFGQFLGAASGGSDGATMKNGVLTALMELFSRVDDVAITPQFSTLTLSAKQRKNAERKAIERPGKSVIGLTTPNEWYESLKGNRISSGFLNRFLVLEATVPRGDLADGSDEEPPAQVVGWIRRVLAPRGNLDVIGRVTELPPAQRLAITDPAMAAFRAFKRECNARADVLEAEKLGELPMRAGEQAMRLALLAALAEDPDAVTVDEPHARWGIAVAGYQLQQLIPAVQERLSDSPVHALRNRFLEALREAGERGLTIKEITRHRVFRGVVKRDREETVQWVQEAGFAGWLELGSSPTGGRPRHALVVTTIQPAEEAA
ncbi:MAG: bifunctional DNA primase/polymerase [Gemmatimonadaceae bacterium]|nr:bifunctional DNA primase/polymerase [Gemmatimonadaceae bacterium]